MKTFIALMLTLSTCYGAFFQASKNKPYHLSVGGVLFNDKGEIACHHFKEIMGQKDIYILMRESMEDGEDILETLSRGFKEEFGAVAEPVAFIGSLSGYLKDPKLSFDKTTLYVVAKASEWDPSKRSLDDPESSSQIEWLKPEELIAYMEIQGKKFKRVDADESEMIKRALPFISSRISESD